MGIRRASGSARSCAHGAAARSGQGEPGTNGSVRRHLHTAGIMALLALPKTIKPTVPTRLGTLLLLLVLLIGMMAIVFTNNLFYLITATLLAFVAISGILAELTLSGLTGRRQLPGRLFAGTPAAVGVEIRNEKPRASSHCLFVRECLDGPFGDDRLFLQVLEPGSSAHRSYLLTLPRRGRLALSGIWVSTLFPFGLWEKAVLLPCVQELIVFPRPLVPTWDSPLHLVDSGATETSVRGDGDGLVSIRDYVPGDASRSIHWRSSARTGSLKVKELERDAQSSLCLVLAPRFGPALETGVSLATGMLLAAHEAGMRTALLTHEETIPMGRGADQLHRQLTRLALYGDAPGDAWRPALPPVRTEDTHRILLYEPRTEPAWASRFEGRRWPVPEAALSHAAGARRGLLT